jgi:hypothetical protein
MASMLTFRISSIKDFSIRRDVREKSGFLKISSLIEEKDGEIGHGDNSTLRKLHWFQERSCLTIFNHKTQLEEKLSITLMA